ncbi:Gfo/Idh/MocA family oxidoreductase [Halorhabdus sp. BNX81]|uniref:Gfo/Idh/MocA family protein n=1 Tax=Halorhabdus sp. BNX81 TaxID=2980181 RepID=UPI0023DD533A|nr:Gfo/Idh/MocA family oxidoreductase [Halorhabdus sp. BNX81]WEL21283.1 D-xylose 1-dehydrogenase (NADP) [Halorhabdus sp. BNX81]
MRFGILSTAGIARTALIPASERSEHEVTAIASRNVDRAETVASELGIPNAYGNYDTMLADAPIDAVYNPLPNALHAEWTMRAADAGHDVLCEKPIGVDTQQAREMHDYCEAQDVTLMEAFMYRFHPRTERAAEIVSEDLANVRSGSATFTFSLRGNPDDIRLDPDLAGGSLMDLGCYTVSAMRLFLGEPERAYATSADTRNAGVDSQLTGILEFDSGATARIHSGFDTPFVESYRVEAENGWLEAENVFGADHDQTVSLEYSVDGRHAVEEFDPVDPYQREVAHFADAVDSGSGPRIDREESIRNMAVIDALYESADRGEPVSLS